ncbi:hypothetical protein ES332_A07G067600v1 [Gossypium tomentosum]|uniref:Strictosidine synthase conserved region domain-containing protein n=1 Tax=Gossypium tomentosum TaxID=34277 RepID=A0A5D2PPK0_GOSTO|nr:hypothetical protein ES332_A07G067600v1 [Gossypium tomentosum]
MATNFMFLRIKTKITLVILFCFLSPIVSAISFTKIRLPKNATRPEALAFELTVPRFFTGIADGRILKYLGPTIGFEEFGFAAPNRPKSVCDGTETANPNPVCGRPLGMALHHRTNQLYVCDAFFGFGVLGRRGGLVTQLSTAADGEPYRFCNGVDVHQPTGNVYFTDASSIFDITNKCYGFDGRLLKYDAKTKQVTVLVRNLSFAAGVAVDEEEKFVMVTEFNANRTRKISLQGGGSVIATIQPTPDNIKRTRLNKFWIAASRVDPRMDSGLLPTGVRINGNGTVLETVNLERWYGNKSVSEIQEFGTKLYIVSRLEDFIGVLLKH